METPLVVRTLEIAPPQPENGPVIPPQEERNNDIKNPGANHLAPNRVCGNIQRGHGRECRKRLGKVIMTTLSDIDGNHDETSDDT